MSIEDWIIVGLVWVTTFLLVLQTFEIWRNRE